MLRILMLGWEYPPHITGGLAVACAGMAGALAGRGHHVSVVLPRLSGDEERSPGISLWDPAKAASYFSAAELHELEHIFARETISNTQASVYGDYGLVREAQTVTTNTSETHPRGTYAAAIHGGYGADIMNQVHRYAAFVKALAGRIEFDVIHAHDWMTYQAGLEAQAVSGRPLICHVHATEFDRGGERVNPEVAGLERHALKKADMVATVSAWTKDIIVQRYGVDPKRVQVVHNGVDGPFDVESDSEHKRRADKDRDKIVLFLGRITYQKGPDYFVRAAKLVVQKIKKVMFVMVGNGDMYRKMVEYAAELGVGKYFHYTGFFERDNVDRVFSMSDVFVMPSVSEPFGITPLEAVKHGVPVIISKQSGVSEVLSSCLKVDFWNVEALAASIIQVLEDEEFADRLIQDARNELRKISWTATAAKLEKMFQEARESKAA